MSIGDDQQPDSGGVEDASAPVADTPASSPIPTVPPPAAPPLPAATPRSALASRYPIEVGVEVPDRIARWRPVVQWLLAIPLFIILYVLRIVMEVCALIGWFAALFTAKLPGGLGDLIAGYYRYAWRTYTYSWFLRDKYPPFGPAFGYNDPGDDPAWFQVEGGHELSRLAVLFRIILVIPQLIVVGVLLLAAYVAVVVAWFAVVITGRWPAGLRNFVVGVGRWAMRVDAWFFLLADPYPPFSLSE